MFDGCTDQSEVKTRVFIRRFKPKNLKRVVVKRTDNVYETKANNIGFKEASQPYIITLQDDMVIHETGWERRLTYPLRYFYDVLAVTSRHAKDIKIMNRQKGVYYMYYNSVASEFHNLDRNVFAMQSVMLSTEVRSHLELIIYGSYIFLTKHSPHVI